MKTNTEKAIYFLQHKLKEGFANLTTHTMLEVMNFINQADKNGLEVTGIKYLRFDGKDFHKSTEDDYYEGGFSAKKIERPVVEHKHTQGEWKKEIQEFGEILIYKDNILIAEFFGGENEQPTPSKEEAEANANLAVQSGKLLEITEKYFDHMKTKPSEGGLTFLMAKEVLDNLK